MLDHHYWMSNEVTGPGPHAFDRSSSYSRKATAIAMGQDYRESRLVKVGAPHHGEAAGSGLSTAVFVLTATEQGN